VSQLLIKYKKKAKAKRKFRRRIVKGKKMREIIGKIKGKGK
jgi:hypothetical protein